jgi:hypothetical protein
MGITITTGLPALARLPQQRPYDLGDVASALRVLGKGFAPLGTSTQDKDQHYARDAYESLQFLACALNLTEEAPFVHQPERVTNWEFLQALTYTWGDYNLLRGSPHDNSIVSRERVLLEDRGVRTLWRIGAINTCLFRDQLHYSVFGLDLGRMHETLEESLASQGKVRRR